MSASIIDVARLAGVGTGTVSRVLSNHPSVSAATRAKVQAAIAALAYRPNTLARGLVQGHTHTLGLVIHDLHLQYFALLLQGAQAAAAARGYSVLIADGDGGPDQLRTCVTLLGERRVDGILAATMVAPDQALAILRSAPVKTVLLDCTGGDETVSSVGGDNERGGYLAAHYLLDLGHRRIAFLGSQHASVCTERLHGYHRAYTERGIAADSSLVSAALLGMAEVVAAVNHFLDSAQPPTAFITANDDYAVAALHALSARGRRVPEEIAVIGYDDIPIAAWLPSPLTTVAQPKQEQGRLAAELLISQIERPDTPAQRIILPPRLVVRHTSGAAVQAAGSAAVRRHPTRARSSRE